MINACARAKFPLASNVVISVGRSLSSATNAPAASVALTFFLSP